MGVGGGEEERRRARREECLEVAEILAISISCERGKEGVTGIAAISQRPKNFVKKNREGREVDTRFRCAKKRETIGQRDL